MADVKKRSGILGIFTSNLDTIVAVAKFVLPASFTGAVVGWSTWFAGIFQQYSPASWVIAGVLGALCGALIMLLATIARERLQLIRFRNGVFAVSQINPLDIMFNGKRLRLVDLAPPIGPSIAGRTFIDCEIVGPANVMFTGCHFQQNGGEIVDGIVIKSPFQPSNGFVFRDCTFTRCKFYLMTFMITEVDYQLFCQQHKGLNWITEEPSQSMLPQVTNETQS